MGDTTLQRSRTLGEILRERGLTIATAESCTGGAVAAAITAIAGSSAYFPGGVVAYSAAIKAALLGVPQAIIDGEGVVSAACALAMAQGRGAPAGPISPSRRPASPGRAARSRESRWGLVYLAVAWDRRGAQSPRGLSRRPRGGHRRRDRDALATGDRM